MAYTRPVALNLRTSRNKFRADRSLATILTRASGLEAVAGQPLLFKAFRHAARDAPFTPQTLSYLAVLCPLCSRGACPYLASAALVNALVTDSQFAAKRTYSQTPHERDSLRHIGIPSVSHATAIAGAISHAPRPGNRQDAQQTQKTSARRAHHRPHHAPYGHGPPPPLERKMHSGAPCFNRAPVRVRPQQ